MPTVHFVQPDDTEQSVEAAPGGSVMHAAVSCGVAGIIAECGGSAMCGTCHVYVAESVLSRLKPADRVETELLAGMSLRRFNSRLSCQIPICDELDGLVVHVPSEQGV
jgi:2Fe-2S ferredoxin